MAKLQSGIYGKASGKIGGTVVSSWKGIQTVREYVIPANPQTPGQTVNRGLFGRISKLGSRILAPVINPFWDPYAVKKTGHNVFTSVNKLAMGQTFNPAILTVSQGQLEPAAISAAPLDGEDVLFSWSQIIAANGQLTDNVAALVLDETTDTFWVNIGNATRDDEAVTVAVGVGLSPANLHAYLFFYSGDGETLIVSPSTYFDVVSV
jgi:hypothetical protein